MTEELATIRKDVLPNGLVVITEQMPQVKTVAMGVWVKSGSRVEPAEVNGISHFIEHMVFKGTEHRSAEEIARAADRLGGHLDAFTAKEYVCFNMKVLDEHLAQGFDILADLVLAPVFRESDIEKERGVILEEMKMDEDNPDYLVHEIFLQNFWRNHPIGRPILGTRETLGGFHHDLVEGFFRRWYVPNQMLITAAGQLEHERFVEMVERKFSHLRPQADGYRDWTPTPEAAITTRRKQELKQVHLCLGVPSYPLPHEQRYAVALLNTILGGGMSSRLFQKIREREGLAYAIFSDLQAYRDTGCITVYAGTARETAEQTLGLTLEEFRRLKREPVSAEELRRAQENLKASLMFSLESTTSRMSYLARQEIYFARFFPAEEVLAAIDAVRPEEMQAAAQEFFQPTLVAVTLLGQLDGLEFTRDALAC
ncbi:MAG: insulinase family protein [Acidobacteria bacterium]|nr:insulinase family protein [Acidobacteriota bacterium]